MLKIGEAEKCPPPQGATKWYSYSPNRRVGNDIPMGPYYTAPVLVDAHFKEKGNNKRPSTPMSVQNKKKVAKFG